MKTWKRNGLTIRMSRLETTPIDQWMGRRRLHMLVRDFSMSITSEGMTQTVVVPAGFRTDWATLPIFTQLVLGNRDDWCEAALLHDMLCETNVPRFICNAWMRAALFCLGAPLWKQRLFFYGLMAVGYGSPVAAIATKIAKFFRRKK